MTDLTRGLRDFVELFERLELHYVLMGGIAVSIHGIPRPTHDVDFTLAINRQRLPELFAAVEDRGYTIPEQYLRGWVDEVAGMPFVKFRLYLESRGIDIDVFLAESPFQQEILNRRLHAEIDGVPAWLVSAEDLILLKLLAGRARDIADIGDILFTQGQLDDDYLRRWADSLGVGDKLDDVLRAHPGI